MNRYIAARIPTELYAKLREAQIKEYKTLSQIVRDALREYLERGRKGDDTEQ
jgi:metal-responsive CopG/Arc/MetJ family transcriptional regulator